MKYRIFVRYQYHPNTKRGGSEPVVWCKWSSLLLEPSEENIGALRERLKELKAKTKATDRATKLKHEYEIREEGW